MTPDERNEHEIKVASAQFLAAKTAQERRVAWNAYRRAHERRSQEQIARMERERSLA
jgi:hypothetical protein